MSSPSSLAEALRLAILNLEIPPRSPLREITLADEHACSRRTVREALQILSRDGLVHRELNRGARVRTFSETDVRDLYTVRRTIEGQGAAACHFAPDSKVAAVEHAFAALDRVARTQQGSLNHAVADMKFHASVIALLESPRIDRFFADIATEMSYAIRLVQQYEVRSQVDILGDLAEHERICDAVVARNSLKAERAVQEHIASNLPHLLKASQDGLPRAPR